MFNFTFCVLAVILFLLHHGEPVSFITKCKSDDPVCAKKSAQTAIPIFADGIPEYGVPTMDPHKIDFVDASSQNLKLLLSDVVVSGMRNCIAKEIRREKVNQKLYIKLLCNVQLDGQYEMDGHLLFLQINGKGAVHATVRKMQVNIETDLTEYQKNGVTHWHIQEKNHTYVLKDKSTVVFENLFPDNKILGDAAREVISNSGNDVVLEVGTPIVNNVVQSVISELDNSFEKMPASELSID